MTSSGSERATVANPAARHRPQGCGQEFFPAVPARRPWKRERGVGRLTIKKRGTAVVPEQLRKQLDLRGDAEATVVLTRVGGTQQVLLVEPV